MLVLLQQKKAERKVERIARDAKDTERDARRQERVQAAVKADQWRRDVEHQKQLANSLRIFNAHRMHVMVLRGATGNFTTGKVCYRAVKGAEFQGRKLKYLVKLNTNIIGGLIWYS